MSDVNDRLDLQATLARGSDAAEDLVMLELALAAIADEEATLDRETRQRTLQAVTRLLHSRASTLIQTFDNLWASSLAD